MTLLPSPQISSTPSGHPAPATSSDGDAPQAMFGDLLAQVLALMLGAWSSPPDGPLSADSPADNSAAPITLSMIGGSSSETSPMPAPTSGVAGPLTRQPLLKAGLLAHETVSLVQQGSLPALDDRAVPALGQACPQDEGGQRPAPVGGESSAPGRGLDADDLPPPAHASRGMASPAVKVALGTGLAAAFEPAAPGQLSPGQALPPSAAGGTQERPATGAALSTMHEHPPTGTDLVHVAFGTPAPAGESRLSPSPVSPQGKPAEGEIAAEHGISRQERATEVLLHGGRGAYEAAGDARSPSSGAGDGLAMPTASQTPGLAPETGPSEAPVAESAFSGLSQKDPDVVDQVLRHARVALRPGRSELSVHLEPPSLGKVDVHLVLDGHGLTVHLGAETHRAKDLLEANLAGLRAGLAEQGVRVERVVVDLNSPGVATGWADLGREQRHAGQQPGRWDGPRLPPPADPPVNQVPRVLASTEPHRDHQVDYWA